MTVINASLVIAGKDIRRELRFRGSLPVTVAFMVMMVLTFRLAFANIEPGPSLVAPLWWAILLFGTFFGIFNSLTGEKEEGCLEGLLMGPHDRKAIYLGKVLSATFTLFLNMLATSAVISLLWGFPLWRFALQLALVGGVGLVGLGILGTLVAALTLRWRNRALMMPLLLVPLQLFTVLIPLVTTTTAILQGAGLSEYVSSLWVVAGFSLFFLIVSLYIFEYVVVE